jgi:hypothetical protein
MLWETTGYGGAMTGTSEESKRRRFGQIYRSEYRKTRSARSTRIMGWLTPVALVGAVLGHHSRVLSIVCYTIAGVLLIGALYTAWREDQARKRAE